MRLPWIQVDKEGIARCRRLARHLKVPEAQGIGIGIMLWEYALEIAPDGDFTGAIPDTESLAAAVMWPTEDAPRLVTEMQRVGLIATTPTLRCCGLDRYKAAWEKNQRRSSKPPDSRGRVPATGDNPPGFAREPHGTARKTETETETETHKKQKTFAGLAGATPPKAKSTKALKEDKPVDPRHAPLIKALAETFVAIKGVPYPFGGGRDAKAVTSLLAKAEPDAIDRAWARALREATHPPIACIYELEPKLAHFVGTGPPNVVDIRKPVTPNTFTESRTVENF